VPEVREALVASGKPYVIENVVGSNLIDPIMLCGAMFGLRTYRHRLFESNMHLIAPPHPRHVAKQTKMGRPVQDGEFMHIVGNFHGADLGRQIMQMPWATRDGLREAIPPVYTEYIGLQIMEYLEAKKAA
jgi:DNA (cytosine-5)-methyltransferase 1